MNNPAWILAQLAPVVVAYAETFPRDKSSLELFDFRNYNGQLREWTCGQSKVHPKEFLRTLPKLALYPAFTRYALDTIPRNTPTWHAFLAFLRYYG